MAPPTASEVAAALAALLPMGDGSGGGGNGVDLKKLSKRNWAVNALIAVVVALSGALAAYKATEQRSKDNEDGVKANRAAISKVEKDVETVVQSVNDMGAVLEQQTQVQERLATGVEQLTQEAKTREEERLRERVRELEEANRELRGR